MSCFFISAPSLSHQQSEQPLPPRRSASCGNDKALDIVALNGGSFIAKRYNPGPCPGDGWQLIASQGKRGDKGERGLQGISGVPVVIQKWRLDRANYIAVPVMSDGCEGPPLELRSLFEQFHTEAR